MQIENMRTSDHIDQIAGALAKAQGAMRNAKKDSYNTFFDSKYADLAEVTDAARAPLSENGLAIVQAPRNDGEGKVSVTCTMIHESGQWIACTLTAPLALKKDGTTDLSVQAVLSVATYLRRANLGAMTGIAAEGEDDDGNTASGKPAKTAPGEMAGTEGAREVIWGKAVKVWPGAGSKPWGVIVETANGNAGAKYWEESATVTGQVEAGRILQIVGVWEAYKGKLSIKAETVDVIEAAPDLEEQARIREQIATPPPAADNDLPFTPDAPAAKFQQPQRKSAR